MSTTVRGIMTTNVPEVERVVDSHARSGNHHTKSTNHPTKPDRHLQRQRQQQRPTFDNEENICLDNMNLSRPFLMSTSKDEQQTLHPQRNDSLRCSQSTRDNRAAHKEYMPADANTVKTAATDSIAQVSTDTLAEGMNSAARIVNGSVHPCVDAIKSDVSLSRRNGERDVKSNGNVRCQHENGNSKFVNSDKRNRSRKRRRDRSSSSSDSSTSSSSSSHSSSSTSSSVSVDTKRSKTSNRGKKGNHTPPVKATKSLKTMEKVEKDAPENIPDDAQVVNTRKSNSDNGATNENRNLKIHANSSRKRASQLINAEIKRTDKSVLLEDENIVVQHDLYSVVFKDTTKVYSLLNTHIKTIMEKAKKDLLAVCEAKLQVFQTNLDRVAKQELGKFQKCLVKANGKIENSHKFVIITSKSSDGVYRLVTAADRDDVIKKTNQFKSVDKLLLQFNNNESFNVDILRGLFKENNMSTKAKNDFLFRGGLTELLEYLVEMFSRSFGDDTDQRNYKLTFMSADRSIPPESLKTSKTGGSRKPAKRKDQSVKRSRNEECTDVSDQEPGISIDGHDNTSTAVERNLETEHSDHEVFVEYSSSSEHDERLEERVQADTRNNDSGHDWKRSKRDDRENCMDDRDRYETSSKKKRRSHREAN